jgi:rhamnosyltransferase
MLENGVNGYANPSVAVIIPTYNGSSLWQICIDALAAQRPAPDRVLVVDSGSTDGSRQRAVAAGFEVVDIPKAAFDHGGTRQLASERLGGFELLIFLTQDAVLQEPTSLSRLVAAFSDQTVGMAVGRQLNRAGAGPIEAHARAFNYPPTSKIRIFEDRTRLGIKVAFASNSFAGYRNAALQSVGGFPKGLILGEDTIVAAKMLQAGLRIAYVADAEVRHSHDYTMMQEFKRYFDTGVMHREQSWLLEAFGKPEGEGRRFIVSELISLWRDAPWLLPSAALRTVFKYAGYKLGWHSALMPLAVKRRLSMHRPHWDRNAG